MINKYPDYTDFVWVKRLSSPDKWTLAYFVCESGRAISESFQDPYTVGDSEGLSVEYFTDVIGWTELTAPS